MTRRKLLSAPVSVLAAATAGDLTIPVHHVVDRRAKWTTAEIGHFWSAIWPETVEDLARASIRLETTLSAGEVERPPSREPVISGLSRGALNVVLTDQIPVYWAAGRAINGVTTLYRGYHLCMIAISWAHGNQIPFVSVNTCLHEILHALMLDIFESRPKGWSGQTREARIDFYATRLWLLHDGAAVRESAGIYARRLQTAAGRIG